MKRLNHLSLSFAISLFIFYYYFNYNFALTFLLSFFVSILSFLPDVDMTIINKLDKFNRNNFYIFFPFVYVLKSFFKHRTITHSVWFPLIFLFLAEYFFVNIFLILFFRVLYIAIFLHIIEDSLTLSGVRIFYPFDFKLKLFRFNTNSIIHFYLLEFLAYFIIILFVFLSI